MQFSNKFIYVHQKLRGASKRVRKKTKTDETINQIIDKDFQLYVGIKTLKISNYDNSLK